MDVVGGQFARGNDAFDLHHADLAGGGGGRIEIARRQVETQVARTVGHIGLDQGDIGHQRALHDIGLAVEFAQLLAVGHQGAHTGLGEEGRDTRPAGAQLLGQRALGRKFKLEFTGQVLTLELLVLPHVGRNHLLDLAGFQQLAQSKAVHTGIVGNRRQVFHTGVAQRVDQGFGNAAQAETAHGEHLAVSHDVLERLGGRGKDFVHSGLLSGDGWHYDTTY